MATTVKVLDQTVNPYRVVGEYETRGEAEQVKADLIAGGHHPLYVQVYDPTARFETVDRTTGERTIHPDYFTALSAVAGAQDSTGHRVDLYETR